MTTPKRPGVPDEEDIAIGDAEIFLETPTAPSAPVLSAEDTGGDVPLIADPLPEMGPDIWLAGIQALVSVGDDASPPAPTTDEWAWEARLYRVEAGLAESPAESAALWLAAARAAERAGDREATDALYEQALVQAPEAPDVLRAVARRAEGEGDFDAALRSWERLAGVAETAEARAFYAALGAEWRLGRQGALSRAAREAIPAGPARALALAETGLVAGATADVAVALVEAGTALRGGVGAVLLEQAARFSETGRDRARAAAQRRAARELDPEMAPSVFGELRDAARIDARTAARPLADLAARLPAASALARAATRAAAGLARRAGDAALAKSLLATLPPTTVTAARDRVDLAIESGEPLDPASVAALRAAAPTGADAATLAWLEAESLARQEAWPEALAVVGRAMEHTPDAVPLALIAEEISASTADTAERATAFDLWLRADPARRADAALALAEARTALADEGSALGARAALQTAIEAAPGSALFWTVAAADARAGRRADAAATLTYGADTWGASPLAPALRAVAAAHLAAGEPRRALDELATPEVAAAFGADARARLAGRVGDREAMAAALAEAADAAGEPERRASLDVARAVLSEDAEGRAAALRAAAEDAPEHPLALGLSLASDGGGGAASELLWQAAERTPASPRQAAFYRLTAATLAELGDDVDDALRRASELVDAAPDDRLAQLAVMRAAARLDPDRRARTLGELPIDPASDPAVALAVAEALVESNQGARAAVVLRDLRRTRFGVEARRALARLGADGGEVMPAGLLHGPADDTAAVVRAELAELGEAVRAERWDAVVGALESGPPQQAAAGAATLHAAALLAAGRVGSAEAARLDAAAVGAAGAEEALSALALAQIADGAAGEAAGRALALCIDRLARVPEPRAVATFELERARRHAGDAPGDGGDGDPALAWQAALAADPTALPAALALRREVARRGDVRAAIDATEVEAGRLIVPAHRVRALLLAAALAEEAARGGEAATDAGATAIPVVDAGAAVPPIAAAGGASLGKGRALRLLNAALEIDPAHDGAFEQLRAVLEDVGDWKGLAAALAARIAIAANPFEVTALRLARAEVLAGKLDDRAGAREELEAILHKQTEHARALARLAELQWEDQAWSDAGETYLRRALVERDPRTLREIYLRLGHIYGERVPDAKRAITAYEKVRTFEPDNREALRALSELYLAEGDAKLALPVTERAAILEPDERRRTALAVRLGELYMRTGDLRRAGVELRRAVDAAPRDLPAVTALAQLYERARDLPGRRALLDHTVSLLRRDVEQGTIDEPTLRALASVLALRERPHAATAAAQLLVALKAGGLAGARDGGGGRSLEGLRRPEADDRSFPPGIAPGIRQLMRHVGPLLRPSGGELGQALARAGVGRADRLARDAAPRPLFAAVAAELHAGEFDLYVAAGGGPKTGGAAALRAEPGAPPALVIGSPIAALGDAALRFAAARLLRLASTGLDLLLAAPPEEAAAIVVGIIRQFVPEYRHPAVRDALVEAESARAARVIPRKLRAQLVAFAVESAGPFDVEALVAAVRDGANAAGLLAAGDLPAALSVLLAARGAANPSAPPSLAAIVADPEARALLRFAISDDYDELARAIESG